ncbi:MAG: thioredoxin-dependent thiol peroxidase [Acidimicrobiia bacterium]|nr:thioredoxin-dependent thiol peroxidase [Acidimicrobiia bacterium]
MTVDAGDRAPAFALQDHTGARVSLRHFAGRNLVIYFYPKAMTPGCTTQACDLRDRHETFAKAGYAIVGISPDPVARLATFVEKEHLPFPMLSDPDHAVAAAYGAWGTKQNYGREYQGIIRSTFVVDPKGVITTAWRNVKATGHGERLLRRISGD